MRELLTDIEERVHSIKSIKEKESELIQMILALSLRMGNRSLAKRCFEKPADFYSLNEKFDDMTFRNE